jgi:hypothetical protein
MDDEQHSRTGLLLRHRAQGLSDRLHGNRTLAKSGESNIVCSVKSEQYTGVQVKQSTWKREGSRMRGEICLVVLYETSLEQVQVTF